MRSDQRQAGFSLVELMFAVVLLAFGLIGVAATLSVSAGMTRNTSDEAAGARVAQAASSMLAQCMTDSEFPDTSGALQAFSPAQHDAVRRQMLSASDRRFAWIPMYRREPGSKMAQIVVAVLRADAQSEFTATSSTPDTTNHLATLIPSAMHVDLSNAVDGPVTATFSNNEDPHDPVTKCVAPGAMVILNSNGVDGKAAGRIYKVGDLLDSAANKWSLVPGFDTPGNYSSSAFVIGRGYADDTRPAAGAYDGASQAVAAYETFVLLK